MVWKVSVVWPGRCLWYGLKVSVVWPEGVCGMAWKVSVVWPGRCLCGDLEGCLGDGLNGAVWLFERRCVVI